MSIMDIVDKLGIAAIPVITIIVLLVVEGVKATPLDNKWLPVIAGGTGAVLGVLAMFFMPEFPAKDILTAIAYGIVSGLAATGAHQIYKQLSGAKEAIGTLMVDTDNEIASFDFTNITPEELAEKNQVKVNVEAYEGKH